MIISNAQEIQQKANDIAQRIVKEYLKGKNPLFLIGSGISMDLKSSNNLDQKVPTMGKMIDKLFSLYNNDSEKEKLSDKDKEDLERRFKVWKLQLENNKKIDRSNIGGILGYFQENVHLKKVWLEFNNWLLNECVNEELGIGIINAEPSMAHFKIAKLYKKVNAFCLTINFDGLLYKALQSQYGKKIHSYYIKDHVERFFTDKSTKSNYAEIQVRGDIFFVKCDSVWCGDEYNTCEFRDETPSRIWESDAIKNRLMCQRNNPMKPSISFPGTYEKDKEIRDILSVLWQYLANKVSCVTTIGISGSWDPVLVAFLSDLARERSIPFIDVNIFPENSYIAKEIADCSLKIPANQFMDMLDHSIEQELENIQTRPKITIKYSRETDGEDKFWDKILKKSEISDFEKELIRHPLVEITFKFAQLGLKSKWWGVEEDQRWHHNRLNHSKGVMKIATFLYEKACVNSGRPERAEEKQFLRIAALLHDIGHIPFSHLIEEVFQELNWRPAGYIESFSHDYYTGEKVRKIFEDAYLREELDKIGYNVDDLIRLINGEFGVGFLDAIINGPIDADKIDYVFRDAASTEVFPHLINPNEFLEEIGSEISISHAGLLVLKGRSSEASLKVLLQREKLYKEFYLSPCIRLLEKAVKFIIITYFVHTYNTLNISENIKEKFSKKEISDFGPIRIEMASEELEKLSETYRGEIDIEMKIIQHMKEILDNKPIDKRVKATIEECLTLVKNVNTSLKCKEEAQRRKLKFFRSKFPWEKIEEIRRDAKTVIIRVPGAILIDVLPPFEFYKTKKRRSRSDGTNVSTEYILSPDLDDMIKEYKSKKGEGEVNIFKIREESESKRALSLFERLLKEEKRIEEVD